MYRKIARICCVALLVSLSFTALAAGAPAPSTSPADARLAEASQALRSEALATLAPSVEEELRPMLANPDALDKSAFVRLVAIREFANYFSRVEKAEEAQLAALQFLLDNPTLLDTLMMAVGEADAPDRVLDVLTRLHQQHGRRLVDYPDLTAALCVVWDAPLKTNAENLRAEAEQPAWLFRYYTTARNRFRFDPQSLPWELGVFVVDNPISPDEVAWAVGRYGGRGAIGAVYFDVPYDYHAYSSGGRKRIEGTDYTLMNLVRVGGICGDQAYFASNVARSLGVPACMAAGLGGGMEGTAHAWVGFLDVRGGKPMWNFSEGRYPEMQYWRGQVQDPRSRESLTDSDVSMLAELVRSSPQDRLVSVAMCKAIDLVAEDRPGDLYMRAINLSPGNREAWVNLAQRGADRKLSDAQMTRAMQVVAKFAARSYPDFAFEIIQRLNSGRGSAQQMRALKEARGLFPQRPDLLAGIRLAEGDLLKDQKKSAAALAAYAEVLQRYNNAGPIVLAALERIERLLREHNELPRLAAIYRDVWQRMPSPTRGGYVRSTPFYLVAERYLMVLSELGDANETERVQTRLNALVASPSRR